jgi:alkanesulfonate monooxygenase SsuD/methylene tetrahydromethanopterin reductase-like flavin-dependent oxidoreductase (luciferase family)
VELGLSIEIQEGMSYAETLAMARAGEELGFDTALLAEHYYPSGLPERYPEGYGERMACDAWVYLAGMARESQKIRLGTLVSPVTFRHPAVLAKLAATLDHVSDGRAELGIGAGWLEPEHRAFGFDFPPPPRRVDLVEEQLQVISGLWTQNPFNHAGRHYHLEDAHFTPRPVQQPRPTLIVGGSATAERLPKLAARYADEYVINSPSLDQCRAAREKLDRACEAIGRDPSQIKLSAFLPVTVGSTQREVEQAFAAYTENNPQYVRMLSSRENWIVGTPDQARGRLTQLARAGVDRALLSVNCELHREMLPLLGTLES